MAAMGAHIAEDSPGAAQRWLAQVKKRVRPCCGCCPWHRPSRGRSRDHGLNRLGVAELAEPALRRVPRCLQRAAAGL